MEGLGGDRLEGFLGVLPRGSREDGHDISLGGVHAMLGFNDGWAGARFFMRTKELSFLVAFGYAEVGTLGAFSC